MDIERMEFTMNNLSKPTMRDIAFAAGVATSTVSKALRGDPTIPETRRAQIREIAGKLGYRPNPMVAALMAQLHHRRRRSDPCRIAWIDLWPGGTGRTTMLDRLLAGARRRATELGFGIEVYSAASDGIDPRRLRRLLVARSHWGFIIPPVPEQSADFNLDVCGLTGVTIGTSLRTPGLHRVSPNHFQGAALAFRRMMEAGHRRIGMVISPEMNLRVDGKWLGAFLATQQSIPLADRIPPCITPLDHTGAIDKWRISQRPDAVLTAERRVVAWLDKQPANARPAIASLMLEERVPGCPGVDYRFEHIGAVAVELVVGQIHRNERGCPAVPHAVEVDSQWQDVHETIFVT